MTCDCYPLRREASQSLGVSAALDPNASDFREQIHKLLPSGADLSIELSGSPSALDDAIASTGFGGRVVIGSWYGEKKAALDLGGAFHRSRIKLISSQVSTIAPELSSRWDKARPPGHKRAASFECAGWDLFYRMLGPRQASAPR